MSAFPMSARPAVILGLDPRIHRRPTVGLQLILRAKPGAGSYEDPGDQKRKTRTKGKTGRPGR